MGEANDKASGLLSGAVPGGLLASLTTGDVQQRLLQRNARSDGTRRRSPKPESFPLPKRWRFVEVFHNDPERYVVQTAVNLAFGARENLVPESLMPNYRAFFLEEFPGAGLVNSGGRQSPAILRTFVCLRAALVRPVATWGRRRRVGRPGESAHRKWFGRS